MATLSIAAVSGGGKSAFDRAEILREAHSATRARMAPSRSFRYGDHYNAEAGGYVPKASYREIFASALRSAWSDAKFAAEEAVYEASLPPIPADMAERIDALTAEAWGQRIDGPGNIRHAVLLAEAGDLRDLARGIL